MKHCRRCSEDKDESEFNRNSSNKDGLQNWCRECTKKRNNDRYKEDPDHRARIMRNNDMSRVRCSEYVAAVKSAGCSVCDEKEPCTLDFHHLDPSEKEGNISGLLNYGLARVKEEISKCVLLCSNCHRKVHAGVLDLGR